MSSREKIPLLVSRIQREFGKNRNAEKAVSMQKYMKSKDMPFYGIQAPERRAIQKKVWQSVNLEISSVSMYETCIQQLWELPYREEKLFAIDLALQHKDYIVRESIPLYESMIREPYGWWDLCDPIAINLIGTVALTDFEYMEPILKRWIQDENTWIRRTAILAHFKQKSSCHSDLLFDFCQSRLPEREFFIRKAIGWALRVYGKTNPDAVISFLKKHKGDMSALTFREGSRILVKQGKM